MTAGLAYAAVVSLAAGLVGWVAWEVIARWRPLPGLGRVGSSIRWVRQETTGWQARRQRMGGRDRRGEALETLLLAVLAGLQAGRPLRQAWLVAAYEVQDPALEPGRTEFIAGLNGGWTLEDGLAHWCRRLRSTVLRRCQAIAAAHRRTGGDVYGPTLSVLRMLRQNRLLSADLHARTAEAQLSARILAAASLAVVLYGITVDPVWLAPLWAEPIGRWAVLYGLLSWSFGFFLLRHLIRSLESPGEW